MNIENFSYRRDNLKARILHFGVGNFHRAHLESYANALLNKYPESGWGICGAMIMPQDEALYRKLKKQNGVYSLSVCGRDGNNYVEWIGSLVELFWSGEDLDSIIDKVADPDIKIISLTITEGGYTLDTPEVQNDISNPAAPKSVFGIIAQGLRRRIQANGMGISILTCDNLQHNGDVCKKIFLEFFEKQDKALADWARENVTFPNSMVDRITPATKPEDVERINQYLDKKDECPVYCEDYLQWVIEDNFIDTRPEFEKVGVEFTDNVDPYEKMKLSLLNASHTLLSYPSFLSGYRKVDIAMGDKKIVKFVQDFMDTDVTPFVPAPPNTDLNLYKKTLIERFANSHVSDQISRLCGDGLSKFQVYVMPIVAQMLDKKVEMKRIAYLFASYYRYIKYKTDDNKEAFEIFEPCLSKEDESKIANATASEFLSAYLLNSIELSKYPEFEKLYLAMVDKIEHQGAMKTLEEIL